jgi:carbon storage regulator
MLVLTRKRNQSIFINGNICVTVVDIRGNHVRLGIEAPDSVPIVREELLNSTSRTGRARGSEATVPPAAGRGEHAPRFLNH